MSLAPDKGRGRFWGDLDPERKAHRDAVREISVHGCRDLSGRMGQSYEKDWGQSGHI